ncbi:hypothetical protein LTS07_004013 [Exophiala sideris]|uniref:Class II aldolase/adducin N-terminal domain-containing protein n=1 Tax=Exophiala sideris TaxID=1016849 RepID=A0ABR0JDW0_9EURO|nr:hypothetical protein LTS07_004013 [Exophiala sideris]KAK5062128.1 hypothetical protein LTR69_004486 [Exophiala sideris]KAK5182375.1 hypothetical protein LTR44_005386 [Eurotiomycetes sp. CCFEE 6388]
MSTTQSSSDDVVLQKYHRDLISGSHILHYHNVLDAFGHLSVRHPFNPAIFIMSRNAAPGTISSPNDLIEYYVEDARPVDPNAAAGFLERCIHNAQQPDDISDLLVRNTHLGSSLAASFGTSHSEEYSPQHVVALMRGHGFTVLAGSIQDCVMRAVYTQKNAAIQTTALTMRAADSSATAPIKYLSQKEVADTTWSIAKSAHRPWGLWLREVEACGLYANSA